MVIPLEILCLLDCCYIRTAANTTQRFGCWQPAFLHYVLAPTSNSAHFIEMGHPALPGSRVSTSQLHRFRNRNDWLPSPTTRQVGSVAQEWIKLGKTPTDRWTVFPLLSLPTDSYTGCSQVIVNILHFQTHSTQSTSLFSISPRIYDIYTHKDSIWWRVS